MAKKRRTKKKSRSRKTRPQRRWIWRVLAWLMLISLLVLAGWVFYLDRKVVTTFEGRRWDLPSRVYAQALELYPEREISIAMLSAELEASGYRPSADLSRPGRFQRRGGRYTVHLRSFRFTDEHSRSRRVEINLDGGRIRSIRNLDSNQSLSLLRLDPAEIASIYPLDDEDRTLVDLASLPELLVTGVQAVEDRKFKHHYGVDFHAIGRAALANLKAGGVVQGGSTLTQQLIKNLYLSADQTLWRKANEAVMALLLELHYEKADILEAYFNEVYLGQQGGRAIHGVGRASEFYFGQPVNRLEPHQIALLTGMIRGASLYNPYRSPQRAKERRDRVLRMFSETGLLSEAELRSAINAPLDVLDDPGQAEQSQAFVELVRQQLRTEYDEDELRSEGLRIFTTLSPSIQAAAQASVDQGLGQLAAGGLDDTLEAAFVVAEPASGEVRALVGGREAASGGFNRALAARRQIGSVIKPLVYLLALEHPRDFSLVSAIDDEPVTLQLENGQTWSPENYGRESHGSVTLLTALANSYNQATVRLGLQLGVPNVLRLIERFGLEADMPAVPAVLLGALELTPIEVAQIYQSIAAGGYTVPLRAVTEVQTTEGESLSRYPLRLQPLQDRAAVSVLNYALTEVTRTGTARALPGLLGSRAPVAGKTGTTNDKRDSWFVGYTGNLLGVVWVGRDDNQPAGVTGSNAAMRLWAELFRQLPTTPVDLRTPEGAHYLWVQPEFGLRSDERCNGAEQIPFVDGSEPEVIDACLRRLGVDPAGGRPPRERESIWEKWFGDDDN